MLSNADLLNFQYRLVCFGDRHWTNLECIEWAINEWAVEVGCMLWQQVVVIHGDNGYDENGKALYGRPDELAVKGADKLAGRVADTFNIKKRAFPPNWNQYGKGAGPIRNQMMVRVGKPTHGLCFHNDIESSKGSADMLSRLKAKGIPVRIITEQMYLEANE